VRNVPLGFDADSVLVVALNMRDVKLDSARTVALRLRLLESARSVPGVSHASLQESTPFGGESSWPIFVTGNRFDPSPRAVQRQHGFTRLLRDDGHADRAWARYREHGRRWRAARRGDR
jgi:hypothetical protein